MKTKQTIMIPSCTRSFWAVLGEVVIVIVFGALPVFGSTITVTNTNDSGAGSLRQAVIDAAAGDSINFSVTGTIQPTSNGPLISPNLTISTPRSCRPATN